MRPIRFLSPYFVVALMLCALTASAQQQNQPPVPLPKPDAVLITFMGEINTVSIGQLMAVVNTQVLAQGISKVTLAIASGGGDTNAAFAAYNYLHNLKQIELTTFNIGNVDSAAMVLFCAGQNRFSLPATRFLIHGNSIVVGANDSSNAGTLQGRLALINSLDTMVAHVLNETTQNKMAKEIDAAVHGQTILTPEDAQKWGLVQAVKPGFMEPGVPVFSIANAAPAETPYKVSSVTSPANN